MFLGILQPIVALRIDISDIDSEYIQVRLYKTIFVKIFNFKILD